MDTKGFCFFCFQQLNRAKGKANINSRSCTNEAGLSSLCNLWTHVGSALGGLVSTEQQDCQSDTLSSLSLKKTPTEIKAPLCQQCRKINSKFDELFCLLEKIRLEMKQCLGKVCSKLESTSAEEALRKLESYDDDESSTDFGLLFGMVELRNELGRKCRLKLSSAAEDMTEKNFKRQKLDSEDSFLQNVVPVQPSSSKPITSSPQESNSNSDDPEEDNNDGRKGTDRDKEKGPSSDSDPEDPDFDSDNQEISGMEVEVDSDLESEISNESRSSGKTFGDILEEAGSSSPPLHPDRMKLAPKAVEEDNSDGNGDDDMSESTNETELNKRNYSVKSQNLSKCKATPSSSRSKTSVGPSFKCPLCGMIFKTNLNLEKHQSEAHPATKFTCDICLKPFSSLETLKSHQLLVSCEAGASAAKKNQRTRKHFCEVCGAGFAQKCRMVLHHKTVHLQIRDYSCPICGKAFTREHARDRHRDNVHEGRKFECLVPGCDKVFTTHYRLRLHSKKDHDADDDA